MPNIITAKIDVRLLEKARFFEGKANAQGHKPLYADIVLIPKKEVGQYGDTHLVVQSKKKEENIQMPIIGNATERGGGAPKAPVAQHGFTPAADDPGLDSDLGF